MTGRQMQLIAWLITAVTDRCRDMDGVLRMNGEIRRHSVGPFEDAGGDAKE